MKVRLDDHTINKYMKLELLELQKLPYLVQATDETILEASKSPQMLETVCLDIGTSLESGIPLEELIRGNKLFLDSEDVEEEELVELLEVETIISSAIAEALSEFEDNNTMMVVDMELDQHGITANIIPSSVTC